eukprot:10555337-Alexandrium_andersonii.AAC.1
MCIRDSGRTLRRGVSSRRRVRPFTDDPSLRASRAWGGSDEPEGSACAPGPRGAAGMGAFRRRAR